MRQLLQILQTSPRTVASGKKRGQIDQPLEQNLHSNHTLTIVVILGMLEL